MNGISVYFIHNTRGLPGGSPHSLVNNGFLRNGKPFFDAIFGGFTRDLPDLVGKRVIYNIKSHR